MNLRRTHYHAKFVIFMLVISLFLPFSTSPTFASVGTENNITVSDNRISMTEKKEIEVCINAEALGYSLQEQNADLSKLVWEYGDKNLLSWKRVDVRDMFSGEMTEYGEEPFFSFSQEPYFQDGQIKATIKNEYLFDGNDAAYWRPWYEYRGIYDLTVTNAENEKSVSTPLRLDVYDSFHAYDELEATIQEIIKNKRDGLYVSYEPIGVSEEGRPVPFLIIAKNKEVVDNYLELKERAEKEPEVVKAEIESGKLSDYQVPVYINNIHANESPGVDSIIEFTKEITSGAAISFVDGMGDEQLYNVDDVLDEIFFLVCPAQNPDAYVSYARGNSFGFDLNRDNTYQTQLESRISTENIAKWNPLTLMELHGFLYYSRSKIMIEPCTPPHEPNLEYDLYMKHALAGAEAFGEAAVANSVYKGTPEWPAGYEIPLRDYFNDGKWETSDDMSSNYTPTYGLFHGTVGYTVECGELNDDSVVMGKYGLIGHTAYVAENKEALFLTQLDFFERANKNEESTETESYFVDVQNNPAADFRPKNINGKFYPEYYVIPLEQSAQRNPAAAYEMGEYLLRNDVQMERLTEDVTVDNVLYKSGSYVVSLHQAKRSMANVVLYSGIKVSGWDSLYSETLTNFPDLRGFDCDEILKEGVFEGKTEKVTKVEKAGTLINKKGSIAVIIENNGLDAIRAVNDLLADDIKVGFVTKGGELYNAGDFVIEYKDMERIGKEYCLALTSTDSVPAAKVIKKPALFVDGNQFDEFAMKEQMNFQTAAQLADANVIFGSSSPAAETMKKIKGGKPYIGAGYDVLDSVKELFPDKLNFVKYEDYEALFKVDYTDHLITASYKSDGDYLAYTKGIAYFTELPESATVLMRAENADDFYISGYLNGKEGELQGKEIAFAYDADGLNLTIFANSITNKAHQEDDYRYAANAIYSELLGDTFTVDRKSSGGGSKGGSSSDSKTPAAPVKVENEKITNTSGGSEFKDMDNHWAKNSVSLLVSKGIIKGRSASTFAPDASITRAEFLQLLFAMAGAENKAGNGMEFIDVAESAWYAKSVEWGVTNGIATGVGGNQFAPNAQITRQDMACMLERYMVTVLKKELGTVNGASGFSDSKEISEYAKNAVEKMQQAGIIKGMGENEFAPKKNATRAEASVMLVNVMERN